MRPRPRIAFFRNAAYREILDLKGKKEGRTTVVDFSYRGSDKDKRTAQWLMNEWTQSNWGRKRIFGHDAFLSSYYLALNLIQAENTPFVFIFNLKKWALFIGNSQCLMSKITFCYIPNPCIWFLNCCSPDGAARINPTNLCHGRDLNPHH